MSGNTPSQLPPDPVTTLGPAEVTQLGAFTYTLVHLLLQKPFPLPAALTRSASLQELLMQETPDMLRLGEHIRDLYLRQEDLHPPLSKGRLFWEALTQAIKILHSGQHTRKFARAQEWCEEEEALAVQAIRLDDIAQDIIDGAFSDGFYSPSKRAQWERVEFALALSERCSDAHLILGVLHEQEGAHQLALRNYETSMRYAAERFGGEEALKQRFSNKREGPLWSVLGGRNYLRPRSALASLLWKLGDYKQAKAHYLAMLKLNPTDNQGLRDDLLCLLLEADDEKALERELKKHRTYTFQDGHTEDIAGTVWHYTNACWLYRKWLLGRDTTTKQDASLALHTAFSHNRFVPSMLLAPDGLPRLEELSAYAKGDGTEAAMYVNMGLKSWQKTPGALQWLEDSARETGLLPVKKRARYMTEPIKINVVTVQEEQDE